MANIAGFEIETPQEVMARMQAQVAQKAASARDPNGINAANSQQVITALFGSPELRKAEATEKALKGAVSSVKQGPGETMFDYQIRLQEAVRGATANLDPSLALQANENIIKLTTDKKQQELLGERLEGNRISNKARQVDLDETILKAQEGRTPVIFKRNTDGQLTAVEILPIGATPEERTAAQERWQEGAAAGVQMIVGTGADQLRIEAPLKLSSANDKGGKTINGSKIGNIQDTIDATSTLLFNGTQALEQFIRAPLALSGPVQSLAATGGVVSFVRNVTGAWSSATSDVEIEEDISMADRVIARPEGQYQTEWGILDRQKGGAAALEDISADSSIARGLVLNLAYTLAKTLDPGGRLSDQDVEMAIQMLSGNGDPTVLKTLLRKRFDAAINAVETHRLRADMGLLEGEIGKDKFRTLDARKEEFNATFKQFEEVIEDNALGRRRATGTAGRVPNSGGATSFQEISREEFQKLPEAERTAYLEQLRASRNN